MVGLARFTQLSGEVVEVGDWSPDEEFPYLPLGNKPKRILICPNPPPSRFLVGGHRYLFKEPRGHAEQQIWSEVIAYRLARQIGVDVPPAFIAIDSRQNSCGVLIEFFYGPNIQRDVRFFHARDRFQASGRTLDEAHGSLRDNVLLSRQHGVVNARVWWAQTVAFDTLIGNTDRHSENWGFLSQQLTSDGEPTYELTPAYDNGSSLGFLIREADLRDYLGGNKLDRFIAKGAHHFGWLSWDRESSHHTNLARILASRYGSTAATMARIGAISDSAIEDVLQFCVACEFPVRFSTQRAEFVLAQIKARRAALMKAIGEAR